MARFALTSAGGQRPPIHLGEIDIGVVDGVPEPVKLTLTNVHMRALRDITVGTDGDGSPFVQLARDDGDKPGVWAAAGEEVVVRGDPLQPSQTVNFWARVVKLDGLDVGDQGFDFVVNSVSTGSENG